MKHHPEPGLAEVNACPAVLREISSILGDSSFRVTALILSMIDIIKKHKTSPYAF